MKRTAQHYDLPENHEPVGGDRELTGILPRGGVLQTVPVNSPPCVRSFRWTLISDLTIQRAGHEERLDGADDFDCDRRSLSECAFSRFLLRENQLTEVQLTAVCWFNYFKASDEEDQILDYRAVSGNVNVTDWFRSYIGNETACAFFSRLLAPHIHARTGQQGYRGSASTCSPSLVTLLTTSLMLYYTLL